MSGGLPEGMEIPVGSALVHIGPHKTGTTALQSAAASIRPELLGLGVHYPGRSIEHSMSLMSMMGRNWGWVGRGGGPVRAAYWKELQSEIGSVSSDRLLISSEFLDEARPEHIQTLLDALDRPVRVVSTLRPLAKILPSSWQQYLKSGHRRTYEDWLTGILSDPPDPKMTPSFWQRQDHGALIERWAEAVGPENVTVAVLGSDHQMIFQVFESMLALPEDTLWARSGEARSNRSMTAAEAELVRQVNVIAQRNEVSWGEYRRLVRTGAIQRMVENYKPTGDDERIATPTWALERTGELGAQAADRIKAVGVQVIGDLDSLGRVSTGSDAAPSTQVPVEAAAEAILGMLSAATDRGGDFAPRKKAPKPAPENRKVSDVPIRELTRIVAKRTKRKVSATVKRAPKPGA